jgi:hypothetical protein
VTQERNCGPAEEFPKSLIHPDKYHLRQYLVDTPNPDLRPVFHLIWHQNYTLRSPGFMDQRLIVPYLKRKGWMARLIHDDLVPTLGEEAITYSTVSTYLHEAQRGPDDATAFPEDF